MNRLRSATFVGIFATTTLLVAAAPPAPEESSRLDTQVAAKKAYKTALEALAKLELEVTAKEKSSYLRGERTFDRIVRLVPGMNGLQPTGSRVTETVSVWFETTLGGTTHIRIRADSTTRELDAGRVGNISARGRAEDLEHELRAKLEKLSG